MTDTGEAIQSIPRLLRFLITRAARSSTHRSETCASGIACAASRDVAIGGLDAHQIGKRIGPVVPIRVMAYHRSFRHLRTHVLCDEPPTGDLRHDRDEIYSALARRRCYLAVDSLASARGFRFWGEGRTASCHGAEDSGGGPDAAGMRAPAG